MFKNLVPVNREQHSGKKLRIAEDFGFAANVNSAPLMLNEFVRSAGLYPVVFIEDPDKDEFRPVVLFGLDSDENLFVDAAGQWQSSYVPAIIRRYPFALAATDDEGQFSICIDDDSPLLNDDEGVPLLTEDGEPAEGMDNAKRFLSELQEADMITANFSRYLAEQNLFTPLNTELRHEDVARKITGCYVVNEERLNKLSDEGFLELRQRRYLPAIYAHLSSLSQFERLIRSKHSRATLEGAAPSDPSANAGAAGSAFQ